MAIEPKIFVVMRDGTPQKPARRYRRCLVDAVIAASREDAVRLANDRNPRRPNERFIVLQLASSESPGADAIKIRARRDAEIADMLELVLG